MKFKNQFDYQRGEVERERFHFCDPKKEMTVPDQSLSIKEMIERFVRGQEVEGGKDHYFDENPTFDDVDPTLDPDFGLSDYSMITNEISSRKAERAERAKQVADGQALASEETAERPKEQAKPSEQQAAMQEATNE